MHASDGDPEDPGSSARLAPGDRLGRFEVVGELGAGGMGVVYTAHDADLQRKVAVKLLRPEVLVGPLHAAEARARLLREAQAMARLAHPNVIAVHEVGTAGERVFVVMELVEGGTLAGWLKAAPRSPRAIVDVFIQAGRGLAAAHRAGLVHRDFKPDNVLVDRDGRARVTDFGLVGTVDEPVDLDTTVKAGMALNVALTQTGAVLGTPSYMSPEQFQGRPADARSDQFAFCVALYEALYGRRPFGGRGYRELHRNVIEGKVEAAPPGARVPAALRRVLLRGLDVDPGARWPDMDGLLAALERATPGARRAWALAGVAAALVAGGVAALVVAGGEEGAPAQRAAIVPAADAAPPPAPAAPAAVQLSDLGGCAEHPVFLDADTIVFDRSLGDSQDLFVVPARGGEVRRLTTPPGFHWNPRRGETPGEIFHIDKDPKTGRSRFARIAAVDGGVHAVDSAAPQAFATGSGAVPARGWVYYARPDAGEIRRLRPGADEPFVTLPPDRIVHFLSLSPDGRWLVVDTARKPGTCRVDLDAATPQLVCRDFAGFIGNTAWSGAGTAYWLANKQGLWRHDVATDQDRLVVPGVVVGGAWDVSPDERLLVYSDCFDRARVLDLGHAGGPLELVAGRLADLAAHPSGRLVMVRRSREGRVVLLRELDGTLRELTTTAIGGVPREPVLDRAGRRVAFRVAGPQPGIYLVDTTPYAPERLTDQPDITPVFLDDGRVAFTRFDAEQRPWVWVVDPAGGEPARAFDKPRYVTDVNPVTGEVLLMSVDYRRLSWWDPKSGKERPLPLEAGWEADAMSSATVSMDGTHVLIGYGTEMWRVPVVGSGKKGAGKQVYKATAPYDGQNRAAQLADGRVLVMPTYWEGELYRVELPAIAPLTP
jgi:hypothetical protein